MQIADLERRRRLMETLGLLSGIHTIEELVTTLRGSARAIARADGITIVRREGNSVAYVAEDAVSPLWAGRRFPIAQCISGVAMIENRPILIPDIRTDSRVPQTAYAPTFVRSMAMFPIGVGEPEMAIGAYWQTAGPIDPQSTALLSSLARSASMTFARVAQREANLRSGIA